MKKIPANIISLVVLFAVTGLAGGGAYYWLETQTDENIQRIAQLRNQMSVLGKGGILPSSANLKTIQNNNAKLDEVLKSLQPNMDSAAAFFTTVRQVKADGKSFQALDPDSWKRLFGEKRDPLRKLAAANKVKLPDDYDFGFKAFRSTNPRPEMTLDLGVQLLVIEHVSKILFNARIKSLNAIKRVLVEDGARSPGAVSSFVQSVGDEALSQPITISPGGIYKVYPFEFSFSCSTDALTAIVNGIAASDCVFVIRSMTVENEKNNIASRSEMKATQAGAGEGSASRKLVVPVVGQESINVRLRLDLVDFQAESAPAPGGNAK